MEIKRIDANFERLIITSMIVSEKFLKNVINIVDINLLKLNYCKIIAHWCVDYFKKYNTAPQKEIQTFFHEWKSKKNNDPDLVKLVNNFLLHISENYQREKNYNEQFAIDQSLRYFKQRKLNELKNKIEELTKNGCEDDAEKLVFEYKKIEVSNYESIDVFSDLSVVEGTLNFEEEELFKFSGDFGRVVGPLYRGDLIAFASPAKRGKTFWLIESGIQATLKGLRVVFFSFEMNKQRVLLRIYQNIVAETKKEKEIEIPYFEKNIDGKFEIKQMKIQKKGIKSKKVKDKIKAIKQILKGGTLKLFCMPPNSVTVKEISNTLDDLLNRENFIPDVLIFDYADIIKTINKNGQHRDLINEKWEALRALCLSRNCLGITATHTNKKTFEMDMKQSDMSEDIRKINHVAVMIGINQKKEEKKKGISRMALLAHREDEFHISDEVVILQSLSIGKPYIDSKINRDCQDYYNRIEKRK